MPTRVVALGGSLAPASTSLAALKVAVEGAAEAGAATELFDVRVLDLPMSVPRTEHVFDAAPRLGEEYLFRDNQPHRKQLEV